MRSRNIWFRKHDRCWYTTLHGKQVRLARGEGPEAKHEAQLAFHRLMLEVAANPGARAGHDRVTVSALFDEYLEHRRHEDSPSTWSERRRILHEFVDRHGAKRVAALIPHDLTQWIDDNRHRWRSADTRAKRVSTVKAALNWGQDSGLVAANPLASVKLGGGGRRRPLTRAEVAALRDAARRELRRRLAGRRFREILAFMRFTGARPGEVRALRWSMVDASRGVATFTEHKTSKVTRKARRLLLLPPALRLLGLIQARGDHDEHVFVSSRGPWTKDGLGSTMRRVRKEADVPDGVVLYGIRHRFGTDNATRMALPTLSALMGHTSARMTEHYIHLDDSDAFDVLTEAARIAARPRRRRAARGDAAGLRPAEASTASDPA